MKNKQSFSSNQTFLSLSSLAMDLKRVALGLHRGSEVMTERFFNEALKRKEEINPNSVDPYINKILGKIEKLLKEKDSQKKAEDALMLSTLIQNYSLRIASK